MIFLELSGWQKAVRGLGALICDVIYTLISKIYELFITVARLNILSSDQIGPIYQRVTMILTIVMTFYITFEFVKYTIQPDTFTDNEKGAGNIMKRIIIVIALIAFTPTIFKTAYDLQNRIIETQLISKMILGTTSTDYTTYGNDFSANMLNLFYYYDEEVCGESGGGECSEAEKMVEENLDHIRQTGDSDIVTGINLSSSRSIFKEKYPAIKFNGILAIIVGAFILYILAMYSIDVGVRYAQLIFLQVMSPVAIMGYIIPKKDGIFQKWGKQCITTYLDLFIRIIIINFTLLLVKVLGDAFETGDIFAGIGEVSTSLKVFTYIVLVMGLLLFAQKAPKLLGELLPNSGGAAGIGFGLGAKGRFEPIGKAFKGIGKTASGTANATGRVVGGVAGTLAGAVAGKGLAGKLRGAVIGAKEGAKKDNKGLPHRRVERAYEAAVQRRQQEEEVLRNTPDVTATGGIQKRMQEERAIGQAAHHKEKWVNKAAEFERKSKLFDVAGGSLDNINKQIDEFKQIKAIKAELKAAEARGASASEIKTIDAKYKRAMQEVRRAITEHNGQITDDMLNPSNFIEVESDILDENGFKTGRKQKFKIMYDAGDRNFSYSVNQVAKNELVKMKAAVAEVPDIAKAKVDINGTERTIEEWLNQPDAEKIYAEFTNKFKDAMVEHKTRFENTNEYVRAQAYKNGIGDSGKK